MSTTLFSRRQFLSATLAGGLIAALPAQSLAGLVADGPFEPSLQARLVSALDAAFAKIHAPGALVGVWQGDQGWTAARGATTMGGKVPATLELHTRVGSVTKTMVGTLTLQLADEGLLSLKDTIDRWFPNFPRASEVTVAMLGTMSSGIGSYTFDDAWVDRYLGDPTRSWAPEQLIEAAASVARPFEPGQGMQYCNTNFVMLGMIVEKLRGKPLGQVLQERIFSPLGMANSSYPSGLELPEKYWRGYTLQGSKDEKPLDATHWTPTFGAGAGQAVSDLHDLRIWAKALGSGALLKPEMQDFRVQPNPHSTKGTRSYCFALGSNNGWLEHSGELPGFNTQVAYLPKRDLSIVVMANSDIPGDDKAGPAVAIYHSVAAAIAPDDLLS